MVNINLNKFQYTINDVIIAPLLFKKIIVNAELDTMVISAAIRLKLQELEAKMIELQSNIKEFFEFVKRAIKQLRERDGTINKEDLALNLMKAMKVVQDKYFCKHFQSLDFKWMAGKETVTSESILSKADTFYRVKTQNNTWGELLKEEEKIVAMEATFKDLNLRLEQANKKGKRSGSQGSGDKNQETRNKENFEVEVGESWKRQEFKEARKDILLVQVS